MARDGSGDYTAPSNTVNPATTGTTISSADFNEFVDDVETAFTESTFTGATSATDNAVMRADGTGGRKVQTSAVIIDDSGNLSSVGTVNTFTLPSSDFVGLTDTQTLTNKTLTSPVINVGSDAQGDVYFRNSGGAFSRLAPGSAGEVLTSGGAGADPSWSAAGSGDVSAASTFGTDNVIVRSDGTSKGVQSTGITVADTTNDVSGVGSITPAAGSAIRTATSDTNTLLLQAYDVDGAAYTTFGTLTAGNTPTFDLSASTTIGSDTIVSLTGSQTLTNKTLTSPTVNSPTIATPTINIGSDAQGDILFRSSGGQLDRLAPGSAGQVLQSGGAGADPSWATVAGTGDVTAAAVMTDNAIVRVDGGAKGVQDTGVTIDDSDNVAGVANFGMTGYADITEMVAPSAPSANIARLYSADDGGGTTKLHMKDSAGAVTIIGGELTYQETEFTASGTYTPPSNLAYAIVWVIGPGAGGSGAEATSASEMSAGGGGGAGGVARIVVDAATFSGTNTVTIGTGGAGGSGAGGSNGSGASSIVINGALTVSASAGAAASGILASAADTINRIGTAGANGAGTNGDQNYALAQPLFAMLLGNGTGIGGAGGGTPFGSGGALKRGASGAGKEVGNDAVGYGGGGGGAVNGASQTASAGGDGGDGYVLIQEFLLS